MRMVALHHLDGRRLLVNPDQVQSLDASATGCCYLRLALPHPQFPKQYQTVIPILETPEEARARLERRERCD